MVYNKQILTGLEHSQYEHPFDKKALENLESSTLLTKLFKYLTKHTVLYIDWSYSINACTVGADTPIIILNSGLIDLCNDEEIMFIIGHEVGHIKSNHMLYHMMAQVINYVIDMLPGGSIFAGGFQYLLYYWYRMSEFTADRAGLLCCQNQDAMIRAFIKMAGLPLQEFDNIQTNTFLQQSRDFQMLDFDSMNKVVKFLSIADSTHPWTVMRSSELLKWIDAGEYDKFVNKRYLE